MQNYTEIASSSTITSSRSLLLNNDKSIMSCFSGTAYPTTNLQVGMLCYRTDTGKLYQLTDTTNKTWVEIANTSRNLSDAVDGKLNLSGGTVTGVTRFNANIAATSTITGTVIVTGGVGVSGSVYAASFVGPLAGNASTASTLATGRTIALSGAVTGTATTFNGSNNITIPVTEVVASYLSGTINAARLTGTYNISISGNAATASSTGTLTGFSTTRNNSTPWLIYGSSGTEGVVEVGRYLDFHGSNTSSEDYTVRLDGGTTGSTLLRLTGHFTASGNVTAYSDIRLKENVEYIEGALAKVHRLNGITFTRNDQEDTETRYVGLIAQEVLQAIPEAVRIGDDANKTLAVDYQGLVGVLVEAVKELNNRLIKLERT
ncbi:tail fiber domain-containing protein [Acinetobacter tibetensis]|uniref:tail fiber domain-containing protein n=1 Tax=Acinetobacter tibetensis TaxID=2943497 RepID=UPI003A4DC479